MAYGMKLSKKDKKEIAGSWGMKVRDVDWDFVEKISKTKDDYYIASSPRVPAGKVFNTEAEAQSWVDSQMRKGSSQAGYIKVKRQN